jgi:signal transduction histidine kinase/CheY-like chemotaxis protein
MWVAAGANCTRDIATLRVVSSGRVLILGSRTSALAERLEARGLQCATSSTVRAAATSLAAVRPDAILLSLPARSVPSALETIRKRAKGVPVVFDGTKSGKQSSFAHLGVDSVARTADEIERQVIGSIRARRAADRDELVRRRLELLLDVTRASFDAHALANVAMLVAPRLKAALSCDHVRVLQFEGEGPRKAVLVDEKGRMLVDLALSPMLRKAIETRSGVGGDGLWVQPVPHEPSLFAALVLRRETPLEQEERDFVAAIGVALANASEQAQSQASLVKMRSSLETAYLERFRELQDANERLKAADRRKNELLAVLSHDLRAPLNVQLGHAHLLLNDERLPEPLKPSAAAIQRSSRKMLELVETLLESSRDEDGRIVLFSKAMDVSETCQEAVHDLQILAKAKGILLQAEAPMSLEVVGDEQKIRQVLQNLITNALKHAQDATVVKVRARLKARPDGDVALVEVSDDGLIANANDLLMAFDRSSGLGLSICRDYVERHGGEIWAEAPASGGALFAFTLPIRARNAPKRSSRQMGAPTVLLAEDDPVFARVCSMGLSGHYRVEHAKDGDEAVAKAKTLLPDIIVMDVFMPNRDGLDALREIRENPATAEIPVLLVSGNPDMTERLKVLDLGHVETLSKPFSLSQLLLRVGNVMKRRATKVAAVGIDAETGLFDHLGLVQGLDAELSRSVRSGRSLSLGSLKSTGLVAQSHVASCAALLSKELRAPDMVGHLGGGVFAVLLPETPLLDAKRLVERLATSLERVVPGWTSRVIEVRDANQSAEAVLEQLLA